MLKMRLSPIVPHFLSAGTAHAFSFFPVCLRAFAFFTTMGTAMNSTMKISSPREIGLVKKIDGLPPLILNA